MLLSLHIRDLALLEAAEVDLSPGLNVLSGETGGGKSLVITALQLLSGARGRAELVRRGASELRVDAEFALPEAAGGRPAVPGLRELVGEIHGGATPEGDVLVVTRIVDARGRSRARIDGRPATLQALRALAGHLLEIHGQGETARLLEPARQAEALDDFAGIADLRHAFRSVRGAALAAAARLDMAADAVQERQQRAEFLRFEVHEMEALDLRDGEAERISGEHELLANFDRLQLAIEGAVNALGEAETGALSTLLRADRCLEPLTATDPALADVRELLAAARAAAVDADALLQSRGAELDFDPARFAEVDARLTELRRGLQRFGPEERDFLDRLERARVELGELEDEAAAASPEVLQRDLDGRLEELAVAANSLHEARRAAAEELSAQLVDELRDLGMPQAGFRVALERQLPVGRQLLESSSEHGPSPVEFEVCPNPGEDWQSLRKTASGGEAARTVLAVRKSLAQRRSPAQSKSPVRRPRSSQSAGRQQPGRDSAKAARPGFAPLVVFDEIDAEIGGRLGLQVGAKLEELAGGHQVLVVTHLPQVAAFAERHLRVGKCVRDGRSVAGVDALSGTAVDHELAAMASGEDSGAAALREARRLRARVRELRRGKMPSSAGEGPAGKRKRKAASGGRRAAAG